MQALVSVRAGVHHIYSSASWNSVASADILLVCLSFGCGGSFYHTVIENIQGLILTPACSDDFHAEVVFCRSRTETVSFNHCLCVCFLYKCEK